MVPTTLHSAETWNMGAAERNTLNVEELRYLRTMCGVTLMNRVRSKEIRRRTVIVRELADRAEQRVLRWFGQVVRMDKGIREKKITRSEVRGTRPRERPQIGWMGSMKRALGARVE